MQRVTITIDDDLLGFLDAFMQRSGAVNRSEALRDILRRSLAPEAPEDADCVAILSYSMDPSMRELGRKVPISRQQHHDSAVAALSVPVDHKTAVEVTVMRGKVGKVSDYANSLFLERGVRHGRLAMIPVEREVEFHLHGSGKAHSHSHFRVKDSF
ncbi:nickel-responsive transcriptional regulator NikR [Tabrizicola sp. WMC-M-20]|nr:nickel-responsive transcriptional regulator NikR [Tabrizicola sp. WMC-M-20]